MEGELISVVMATYNEPPEIVEASIRSILGQTYQNFELLIYDDSSDKRTRERIDSFLGDTRVRVIRHDIRSGFVRSLNMGLHDARGTYIARMDGDDIALPERFEKEVSFLRAHRGICVVGGQIEIIDENGRVTSSRSYPAGGIRLAVFSAIRNPLAHPAVMMRREVIDRGFVYDETLGMSEDLDLWLRLMSHSIKLANLPDIVLKYRVTDDFSSRRTSRRQREYTAYVRRKNFDSRRLACSCLSLAVSFVLCIVPAEAIRRIYKRENGRDGILK